MPSDVSPARRWTDGEAPSTCTKLAHLVRVSAPHVPETVWPTHGNFIAKGAPRYYQARLFNGGTHQHVIYSEEWAQSPFLD